MRNTNRLLIRLNKAIDCSNSKYLSERALAVILFDNLIETHLYHLLTYNMFINKNSNMYCLNAWLSYLDTGKIQYLNEFDINYDEESLIKSIKTFY